MASLSLLRVGSAQIFAWVCPRVQVSTVDENLNISILITCPDSPGSREQMPYAGTNAGTKRGVNEGGKHGPGET